MPKFADLKISRKILGTFVLFAVVSIAATVFATGRMRFIDDSYGDLIDGPGRANMAVARANRNLVYIDRSLYRLLAETTVEGARQAVQEITDAESFFDRQIKIAIKGMPSQAGAIQHVADAYQRAKAGSCAEVISLGSSTEPTNRQLAHTRMKSACDPALNALMEEISALTNKIIKLNDDASEAALAVTDATITNTYLLVLGGLAVLILLAATVAQRSIANPIKQVTASLEQLARGQLDIEIGFVTRRDEVGGIARAARVFREAMQQNLAAEAQRQAESAAAEARQVAALREAAEQIERQSSEVTRSTSESSKALAACAQTLFDSAARAVTSVNAVHGATELAVRSSDVVAACGQELAASSAEIAHQIGSTVVEIAGAAQAGQRARGVIGQLAIAVGEIDAVARLIGEIAGRTNLLALNATIEAARAGEAGRGFAVVANEVKALASQTARSTAEISQNIGNIRQVTDAAVASVNEVVSRMAALEQITRTVADATERQNEATGEIARNVGQAAGAMRSVSEQVESVSGEMRSTDEAIENIRSAAANVNDRIADLGHVLARIVRTSSDAANRRTAERKKLEMAGLVIDGARKVAVNCVDLSTIGARLQPSEQLSVGRTVLLRLPNLPDLPGRIIRADDDVGLQFDWHPDEAPPSLHVLLEQAIAA